MGLNLHGRLRSLTLFLSLAAVALSGCGGPAEEGMPPASIRPANSADGDKTPPKPDGVNAAPLQVGQNPGTAPSVNPGGASVNHETLFDGWQAPKAVIVVTGQQHGYIEPCGCTGLANQKGGLSRRHTLLKQLAEKRWTTVAIDVGNQVRRYGKQAEIKLQATANGLRTMNYRAIGFGPDDLKLTGTELYSITADTERPSPFVSANLAVLDEALTRKLQTIEAGGLKIGVTAVLGTAEQKQINNADVRMKPPVEGLREVWPQLEAERCDVYVLLAHASLEESRELARQFPGFDLIVTAGGAGEPTLEPEKIEGAKGVMVQVGTKGMYAGVVGVFAPGELRYQRVPLDARFPDSKAMLALLASYQKTLEAEGLPGLAVQPIPHSSGNQFVGSAKCAECHDAEYEIWKNSPHAHATDSLVHPNERSEIPRHFDPECLSCHVTGWNPQKFFPYTSGYLDLQKSAHLHGSGCENCHGPSSAHVAAESGETTLGADEIKLLRQSMRLPLSRAEQKCMECHDLDNSPDFHVEGAFRRYWEQIEH
jgi:hypothetical protein